LARLRVYTDENVDVRVVEGLRRRGVDAMSHDEDTVGISDEAHLAHAGRLKAVLFTHDPDFVAIAAEANRRKNNHYGIIFVAMHRLGVGECIRRLALYAEVVTAEEMINRVEFL